MDKRSILFIAALSASLFFVNYWFAPEKEQEQVSEPVTTAVVEAPITTSTPIEVAQGRLYVLENDYQQVVFSSIGGSIAEINLPLQSASNQKSLVLPIGFDRIMAEDYPYNDHFPENSFYVYKEGQITEVNRGPIGNYYPLLRRSVLGDSKTPITPMSPRYYAFSLVSDWEDLYNQPYEVTRFEKNLIEFSRSDSRRKITKTFTLSSDKTPYCLEVEVKVDGDTRDIWVSTGVPDVELVSNNFTPTLKYFQQKSQKNQVESLSLPKSSTVYSSISPSWLSNSNGFFGVIVEPLTDFVSGFKANLIPGQLAPTRLSIIDAQYDLYPLDSYPGYEFLLPMKTSSMKMRFFAGPYQSDLLKNLDFTLSRTEKNPNFISAISFQGWLTFISEPFSKFLFFLMQIFYQFTNSWGFSIIFLTIALRLMLYPLNAWSIKSSVRMQKIAPKISALQEKYKKDPKKAQLEIMALYKESGANPLTGCLPILIQIPFLIGMFDLLKSVFELRGACFIPGWIPNLTAPDVVFSWSYPIFFIGTSFHLLPPLLGVVMFLQQKMSSQTPKHATNLTDAQKQQRLMGNIMVIFFTVISYHFPSGLNIYWLSSMLLGILQQWLTSKKMSQESLISKR